MSSTDAGADRLLSASALKQVRLALSASESPDIERLGLAEDHLRLTLAEITRAILVAHGTLAYGGHLEPSGYTALIRNELHRYSRRDQPFHVYLAHHLHCLKSDGDLKAEVEELGLFGKLILLSPDGRELSIGDASRTAPAPNAEAVASSLTAMRCRLADDANGRFLIGGRRSSFQGQIPGLVEECLLSLERNQPLFLAGGFGGVTLDVARTLQLPGADWLTPLDGEERSPGLEEGQQTIKAFRQSEAWTGLNNGLDDDENRLLLQSYRPSEIAALVVRGLGRLAARKGGSSSS